MPQDRNIACLQLALECVKISQSNYNTPNDVLRNTRNIYYDILDIISLKDSAYNCDSNGTESSYYDIKSSIFDDYLVCLEDGKRLKTLKRHLKAKYGMTINDYKRKWGLRQLIIQQFVNLMHKKEVKLLLIETQQKRKMIKR